MRYAPISHLSSCEIVQGPVQTNAPIRRGHHYVRILRQLDRPAVGQIPSGSEHTPRTHDFVAVQCEE
jgi:hypothetical protein